MPVDKAMPEDIAIAMAGLPISIALHHQEARIYFRHWLRHDDCDGIRVSVNSDDIAAEYKRYPAGAHPGNAELTALVYRLSDKLLPLHRVFFHGAAVLFDGRAWIFTGPSTVGKTTQYRHLKEAHGGDIELICGDRPIVEAMPDGTVTVHPTPWNGKENLKSCMKHATLGGFICLKQEAENSIRVMPHAEKTLYLFRQMMFLPDCREKVLLAGDILSSMVKSAPAWLLANNADEESSELVYGVMRDASKGKIHGQSLELK